MNKIENIFNIDNFLNSITIINSNLNKNKFDNYIDENGKLNLLFKYTFLNLANDFFLNKIKKLDKEHKYYRITGKANKIPDNIKNLSHKLYEEYINTYYNNYFININVHKKIIKANHPEWYRDQPCLPKTPSFIIECINNLFYICDFSLEESIQGYKYSKELLKDIKNEELNPFCIENKKILKNEFKDLYNEEVNNYINSLDNIPSEEEFLNKLDLKEIEVDKTRLCLNRELSDNKTPLNNLLNKFIEILIN